MQNSNVEETDRKVLLCCACRIILPWGNEFFLRFPSIRQNVLCNECAEIHVADAQNQKRLEELVSDDPITEPVNEDESQVSGQLLEEYIVYEELEESASETEEMPVYTCKKCGKTCNTPVHLQVHEYMRHREDYRAQRIKNNEFYCQICDTCYPNIDRLEYHFNHKHGKGRGNRSGIIAERPPEGVAGLRYMRSLEDLKAWTTESLPSDSVSKNLCSICNASFKLNYQYEHHMTTHAAVLPLERTTPDDITMFDCVVCHKSYGSINKLLSHGYFQHNPIKRSQHKPFAKFAEPSNFPCTLCGRNYKSKSNLTAHKHYMHRDSSKRYPCRICPKRYESLLLRRTHENDDHRDPATLWYQCSQCTSQCRRIVDMEVHLTTSHGDKDRIHCEQCGKSFSSKRYLKQHMRCHTATKSLECKLCFKLFKFADQLNRHVKRHDAARPFECLSCGKRYQEKKDLQRHALTHDPTAEKTFQCEECPSRFYDRKTLGGHMRSVHKVKVDRVNEASIIQISSLN